MPLFPKRSGKEEVTKGVLNEQNVQSKYGHQENPTSNDYSEEDTQPPTFYCQQAQGSPTGIISGFNNVKELYQKISECYDFDPNEILFCTLNTHKVNMNKLLGAQLALTDFIFVHRKGRAKEVELTKEEEALGLTITDNGNGLAFIKRIKPGGVIDKVPVIQVYIITSYLLKVFCVLQDRVFLEDSNLQKIRGLVKHQRLLVGDHIQKIDNTSLVGKRHFEVAQKLKDIPIGTTFTLRLISPLKAGFYNIGPNEYRGSRKKTGYGSGKETLRFKAAGKAVVQVIEDETMVEKAVNGINELLESYIGISDSELATRIWEVSNGMKNSLDFLVALNNTDLCELGFSDSFVFELWGVVTDARDGRL